MMGALIYFQLTKKPSYLIQHLLDSIKFLLVKELTLKRFTIERFLNMEVYSDVLLYH